MAPPIGIRYYNVRNSGIAIIIYPQLRKCSNDSEKIWDGRDHHGYNIGINQDWTVDLNETGISPTEKEKFYLSVNTFWGSDMWDKSQQFYYDPNSTIVASATRWGGAHDGSLSYQGIKSKAINARMAASSRLAHSDTEMLFAEQFELYAASVAHEMVRQLCDNAFAEFASGFPWKGLVEWAQQLPPQQVVLGISLITAALIAKGYGLTYTTTTNPDGSKTTTVRFGPHQPGVPGAVPEKIKTDWNASVDAARKCNPVNLGVFPNTVELTDGSDVNFPATSAEI